jgi:hypothetical protein
MLSARWHHAECRVRNSLHSLAVTVDIQDISLGNNSGAPSRNTCQQKLAHCIDDREFVTLNKTPHTVAIHTALADAQRWNTINKLTRAGSAQDIERKCSRYRKIIGHKRLEQAPEQKARFISKLRLTCLSELWCCLLCGGKCRKGFEFISHEKCLLLDFPFVHLPRNLL